MQNHNIDFLFFDAGGGHRAAASALQLVIEQQRRPWTVRLVNLQEMLDQLDVFRKVTGIRLQDIYNLLLKREWTLGSARLLRAMQLVIRLYHRRQVELLASYWRHSRPDLVVSMIPNFNRAIAESVRQALPGVPFLTVITDIADHPPHFWMERETEYVVCGSARAVEQARALGIPIERIFRASGMVIHPRFYQSPVLDRAAERVRLGLKPDLPAGLVLFGGQGSAEIARIAARLDRAGLAVQLILICGRNRKLYEALRARRFKLPVLVEGFTAEVPYYMRLADFFIGKPGPGSISEALAMRLPVIVQRNLWTLPQERYNAEWVVEQGAGMVLRGFRRVEEAVRALLEPATFARYRERAAAVENRAVFEIPEIFDRLLSARPV